MNNKKLQLLKRRNKYLFKKYGVSVDLSNVDSTSELNKKVREYNRTLKQKQIETKAAKYNLSGIKTERKLKSELFKLKEKEKFSKRVEKFSRKLVEYNKDKVFRKGQEGFRFLPKNEKELKAAEKALKLAKKGNIEKAVKTLNPKAKGKNLRETTRELDIKSLKANKYALSYKDYSFMQTSIREASTGKFPALGRLFKMGGFDFIKDLHDSGFTLQEYKYMLEFNSEDDDAETIMFKLRAVRKYLMKHNQKILDEFFKTL